VQKEQHQHSVTTTPLIVCSGWTDPDRPHSGQRSGVCRINGTRGLFQFSGHIRHPTGTVGAGTTLSNGEMTSH